MRRNLKKRMRNSVNENTIHAEETSVERTCCKQHSSRVFEIPQSGIMENSVERTV